jgi:hypothetical protein
MSNEDPALDVPSGVDPACHEPAGDGRVVVVGWVFGALALLMVPWTAFLSTTLPSSARAAHYDLAWAGFDLGLLVALGLTGVAAVRLSRWLPALAGATAALLLVDAWFDVVTAPSRAELAAALTMAVVVELPLAALCGWLAVGGQHLFERRVALAAWRRSRPVDPVRPTPR